MAGGIEWLRWHHGTAADPKLGLIARTAGVRVADVLATWACLLEEASQAVKRGNVSRVSPDVLDYQLGMDEGSAARIIDAMTARGMISAGHLTAWERRQPVREREGDISTDRVRAHRERKRQEGETQAAPRSDGADGNTAERGETPGNAMQRPRGEERREDKRREEDNTPLPPQGGAAVAAVVPEKATRQQQVPCPEGVPADAWAAWIGVRRAKRAGPVTAVALAGLQREASAAGLTLAEGVRTCAERGWQSLRADWLTPSHPAARNALTGESDYERRARERIAEFCPDIARPAPTARRSTTIDMGHADVIDATPAIPRFA